MAETLRVGIVGTGRAGQCHAAAYSRLPDVAVTGLWNRTRSRAEKLAATLDGPNIEIYQDWRELIERGGVDIISITADPVVRQGPFAEALAQQRHVLVEKPLALDLPEAREMASLARQARTVTAISFNWRYSPGCQTTWRAIREGPDRATAGHPQRVADARKPRVKALVPGGRITPGGWQSRI